MNNADLKTILGDTDIYLVDQIMKGRYKKDDVVLDAGCGGGRNLKWFLINEFVIYGIDTNPLLIADIQKKNPVPLNRFLQSPVETMPFDDCFFDAIISSAVLHFAKNTNHFFEMMNEMLRVLKRGGSLFIRMTSDIGIENKVVPINKGVYLIPDGSNRFLLTRSLLDQLLRRYPLTMAEDFKTVNVNDVRCMSTLVFIKG